jgi:hypothetical protein
MLPEIIGLNIVGDINKGEAAANVENPAEGHRVIGKDRVESNMFCFLIAVSSNLLNISLCGVILFCDCVESGLDPESLASEHD